MDNTCADYLIKIGFEHWSRSHFTGARYDIMTTNIAESWNAVLREARGFPIISLVEYIRTKIMTWFSQRREAAEAATNTLTPKTEEILAVNFKESAGYDIRTINATEFEVRDKNGLSYHVSLANKTCSCYKFQMLHIPCCHAVGAAVKAKVSVDSLVAEEYSSTYWKKAYESSINPAIRFDSVSTVTDNLAEMYLYPPTTRRPPGRPKKKCFSLEANIV